MGFKHLFLAANALSLTPLASAWTFVWANSTDSGTVETASSPQKCKQIYLEEGSPFSWNPDGSAWCIGLWKDDGCSQRGGLSCDSNEWGHNSSQNIGSFNVYKKSSTTTTASSSKSTSTSTSSSTSTSESSPSSSPIAADAEDAASAESTSSSYPKHGPPLSPGATAGIVVGIVAGVGIIAALFFIWGRRRRSSEPTPAAAAASSPPSSSHQQDPPAYTNSIPEAPDTPVNNAPAALHKPVPIQGEKMSTFLAESAGVDGQKKPAVPPAELAADLGMVELGDTSLGRRN